MIHRRRFILLIVSMAGTSTIVGGVTILKLYRAELEGRRHRLIEQAQSQARLIEAVGQFDAAHSRADHAEGASGATFAQIRAAHRAYVGFGKTGEFALARRDGDRIVFLLSRRFDHDTKRKLIAFTDEATPTRKAKPAGVMGAEIWVNVGDPPPTGPGELSFLSVDTRTPYVAGNAGADGGHAAHYRLRWVSTTGEKGPWSETVSATIGA